MGILNLNNKRYFVINIKHFFCWRGFKIFFHLLTGYFYCTY